MPTPVALYDLTYAQMTELLTGWGEPRFRAEQIWSWLYRSLVPDFGAMSNLPTALRERLATETELKLLTAVNVEESASGQTVKTLFRLRDGHTIESVLMRYHDRRTACISTQVGCGMGCVFCATGQGGLARNLSTGEIVAQAVYIAQDIRFRQFDQAVGQLTGLQLQEHAVTNVVLMGMGEPLANYAATWQAVEALADPRGFNLGARRITLSTVGLVPGIRRMAEERLPINLSVSLHAADDELRNRLVPLNLRYPLAELMAAVRDYVKKTGRRVSFEYALIDGINDRAEQARQLAVLLDGLLCHVNLIPLNPTAGSVLRPSPRDQVEAFREVLQRAAIPVSVRLRRGISIEAGCGQLRQRQAGIAVG